MKRFEVPIKLLKLGEYAPGDYGLKVAMILAHEMKAEANKGVKKVQIIPFRDPRLSPYTWAVISRTQNFLVDNFFGQVYEDRTRGYFRYILASDRFFNLKTIEVPYALATSGLSLRALYFYNRMALDLRHKKTNCLTFNITRFASDSDLRYLESFYPLPHRAYARGDDFIRRYRTQPMFVQQFKRHIYELEDLEVIKTARGNLGQLQVILL